MDFSERAARNEEVFRSVNEQIEQGAEKHAVVGLVRFHCECDRESCFDRLELHAPRYREILQQPYMFVVAPGHDDPRVERLIERHESYSVVEKIGEAREALDRQHPQTPHQH